MSINISKSKVIIAALDWGLGHASRMIPIIEYFLSKKYQLAIASSGSALKLLQSRFPNLPSYELPSYNISYKHNSMSLSMLWQIPKILKARKQENRALENILKEFQADLIVSDNRYGFYNNNVPSVFVTHQLQILSPKGLGFMNPILKKLHYRLLSNFQQIWVPDFIGENSLAGQLSNIKNADSKIKYIGPLSRFKSEEIVHSSDNDIINILVIISGPEPARTNFESKLIAQLENIEGKIVLLRGLPNSDNVIENNRIEVYNHLEDEKLLPIMKQADIVISRSGYSTIMDLYFQGKKAIFIPTKGQTEQEYLANRFMNKGMFYSQSEGNLDLQLALSEVYKYKGFNETHSSNFDNLDKALLELGFNK